MGGGVAKPLGAMAAIVIAWAAAGHAADRQQQPAVARPDGKVAADPKVVTEPPTDPEFDASLESLIPMSPGQIRQMRRKLDAQQRAASEIPLANGRKLEMVSRSVAMSISPSQQAEMLTLFSKHVTTLVFFDSSGAPWPVVAHRVGDVETLEVELPQPGSNALTLVPQSQYVDSNNLTVFLKDQPMPMVFRFKVGDPQVDGRVSVRLDVRGPNSFDTPINVSAPSAAGGSVLMSFLDGVPPAGARSVRLQGGDPSARAWSMGGSIYLRTSMLLMLPPYRQSTRLGQTFVYEMPETPVMRASWEGREVSVQVSGESYDPALPSSPYLPRARGEPTRIAPAGAPK